MFIPTAEERERMIKHTKKWVLEMEAEEKLALEKKDIGKTSGPISAAKALSEVAPEMSQKRA